LWLTRTLEGNIMTTGFQLSLYFFVALLDHCRIVGTAQVWERRSSLEVPIWASSCDSRYVGGLLGQIYWLLVQFLPQLLLATQLTCFSNNKKRRWPDAHLVSAFLRINLRNPVHHLAAKCRPNQTSESLVLVRTRLLADVSY
jgi:hypothetical protein